MNKEDIRNYLEIVEGALEKICKAKIYTDKRILGEKIREAKKNAHNEVIQYKLELMKICNMEDVGDDLFDWGYLESDLQTISEKLKEISNEDKN